MLIFYSLTFYGLNSSLSSNLNVVYTREEDICCQHCAPGKKTVDCSPESLSSRIWPLEPIISKMSQSENKPFLKCIGGLRFRLTQCYSCRNHWAKQNSGLFNHKTIKPLLDHSNNHWPTRSISFRDYITILYMQKRTDIQYHGWAKDSTMLYV